MKFRWSVAASSLTLIICNT